MHPSEKGELFGQNTQGKHTLTEAFFANHAALIDRLQAKDLSEEDWKGLLYDRDTAAFYGDPAWEARMADHEKTVVTDHFVPIQNPRTCEPGQATL